MQTPQTQDIYESLNAAELWLRDGLSTIDNPGFGMSVEVDMSTCKTIIARIRQEQDLRCTFTHLFVKATAIALSQNPTIHQMVSGRRRLLPQQVDIGLSVSGDTFVAPVMVIEDASRKTIEHIAAEVIARVPLVRQQDRQQLLALKKWGWLVPFSGVRRAFLGFLLSRLWFRRQGIGTFQISCLATVDRFMPFLFSTTAILGFGCVKDKVIAIDGQPVVRPMVTVSCCADHKVCDGVKMAQFLVELKALLESGNLESLG